MRNDFISNPARPFERIARIDANTKDTWLAVLTDGTKVPVSRGGYARFREIVGGE